MTDLHPPATGSDDSPARDDLTNGSATSDPTATSDELIESRVADAATATLESSTSDDAMPSDATARTTDVAASDDATASETTARTGEVAEAVASDDATEFAAANDAEEPAVEAMDADRTFPRDEALSGAAAATETIGDDADALAAAAGADVAEPPDAGANAAAADTDLAEPPDADAVGAPAVDIESAEAPTIAASDTDLAEPPDADAVGAPAVDIESAEAPTIAASDTDLAEPPDADAVGAPAVDIESAEAPTIAASDTDLAEPPDADAVGAPAVDIESAEAPTIAASDEAAPPVAAPAEVHAPPMTVAALMARQLRAAGVRFAFTVPGESFLPLLEAFVDEGIRVVSTRHESGAAFMAEAYGQLTGRPAVVVGTRAVGAANMAIGIHTARQDSTPMVAIVGQVARRFRGREAFQEVDQVGSFGRLAKWATELSDRNTVSNALEEVLRHLRTGRPGPVLVSVPEDLLDERVPASTAQPPRGRTLELDPTIVRSILHQLAGARRPVILAGAGVLRARATNDLVEFAEMLEVPVVASWRRPDSFPNQHRLYLGMTGYGAASTVHPRIREADALLVLGSRLNEIATFDYAIPVRGQAWAHVDLEPRAGTHGLSAPTLSLAADVRSFLRSAIERLKGGALEAELVDARATTNRADRDAFETASIVDADDWTGTGVHPGRIVATLSRVLTADTILTTDAGNFASWAARGYRFRRPATFIGPTSGAMGYGFPAAIAAALARPNRPAVALVGDGGFAMTMSELETAVRERARVVVIVFDNQRYGTIRAHQERRGRRPIGTDLGPIDFASIADAFGARGMRVETDEAFEPALREALAQTGPTVLHLTLDRRWLAIDNVRDE